MKRRLMLATPAGAVAAPSDRAGLRGKLTVVNGKGEPRVALMARMGATETGNKGELREALGDNARVAMDEALYVAPNDRMHGTRSQRCARCSHFAREGKRMIGKCDALHYPGKPHRLAIVHADGYCTLFSMFEKSEEPELVKAAGGERPGHKYIKRTRNPHGGWRYEYEHPKHGRMFVETRAEARPGVLPYYISDRVRYSASAYGLQGIGGHVTADTREADPRRMMHNFDETDTAPSDAHVGEVLKHALRDTHKRWMLKHRGKDRKVREALERQRRTEADLRARGLTPTKSEAGLSEKLHRTLGYGATLHEFHNIARRHFQNTLRGYKDATGIRHPLASRKMQKSEPTSIIPVERLRFRGNAQLVKAERITTLEALAKSRGYYPDMPGSAPRWETPEMPDFADIYFQPEDNEHRKREKKQQAVRRRANAERNRGRFGFHGSALQLTPELRYEPDETLSQPNRNLADKQPTLVAQRSMPRLTAGNTDFGNASLHRNSVKRKRKRGRVARRYR